MTKKVKKLWMPLLLGVLLISTLVGVAGARPNARPEASPALQNHMISAHHCTAHDETQNYGLWGSLLKCDAANCQFSCSIKPPHEGLIRVQRLAMYAADNAPGDVCVSLNHVFPKTGGLLARLVNQCTTNDTADPQVVAMNPANFKVSVLQDLQVWVVFTGVNQKLYGFKLLYEPM